MALPTPLKWAWDHKRPLVMMAMIAAGYVVKKVAPLAQDELELLDALWAVLGFGAVLTPNFAQSKKAAE